ncbi:hypothetical protein BaRGS_00027135 [Batillaria attramentaria]|uniref:Uncharacterized protein n=1 Tax=Batillaria attramentaria TaxID=370345 RepID=A0ABD0K3J0_9CAEN
MTSSTTSTREGTERRTQNRRRKGTALVQASQERLVRVSPAERILKLEQRPLQKLLPRQVLVPKYRARTVTPAVSRQSSGSSQASVSRQSSISPTPGSKLSKAGGKKVTGTMIPGVDILAAGDSPASQTQAERQRDTNTGGVSKIPRASKTASGPLTDSFDDELLFAGPPESDQGAQGVVTSGVSSGTGTALTKPSMVSSVAGTVLNKPNKHLANVQQMMLPAVQTAHSSDLTSIAQRSPLRNGAEKTMEIQGTKGLSHVQKDPSKHSPREIDGAKGATGILGEVTPAVMLNQLSAHVDSRDMGDGSTVRHLFCERLCGKSELASHWDGNKPYGNLRLSQSA